MLIIQYVGELGERAVLLHHLESFVIALWLYYYYYYPNIQYLAAWYVYFSFKECYILYMQ